MHALALDDGIPWRALLTTGQAIGEALERCKLELEMGSPFIDPNAVS